MTPPDFISHCLSMEPTQNINSMNVRNPNVIIILLFCSFGALSVVFLLVVYHKDIFSNQETRLNPGLSVKNTCPTVSFNHSVEPFRESDAMMYNYFKEQRIERLSHFNETQFAEYAYISNFDEVIGERFDWRIQSHVDYFAKNYAFAGLIYSGAKFVDSAVVKLDQLERSKKCKYEKKVSCWDNFQYGNFIDATTIIDNGFLIRYEFANVNYTNYMEYFVNWVGMNELLC